MADRLRLVGWNIQPVLMVDDGENLTPIQVPPISISAGQWEQFKNGGDEQALAELREQYARQSQALDGKR
jgi:hypothetical protein